MTFYKTIFSITVLSEEPFGDYSRLAEIDYAITEGDCVGGNMTATQTELSGKEAADALIALGSEPGFFNLDHEGNELTED